MYVERLIWDAWNVEHIAQHRVTVDQVEQACRSRHVTLETYQDRILLIGIVDNNLITVVLAPEQLEGIYYVVTARPSSRKERRYYRGVVEAEGHEETNN